jgi:hypothetical protein
MKIKDIAKIDACLFIALLPLVDRMDKATSNFSLVAPLKIVLSPLTLASGSADIRTDSETILYCIRFYDVPDGSTDCLLEALSKNSRKSAKFVIYVTNFLEIGR